MIEDQTSMVVEEIPLLEEVKVQAQRDPSFLDRFIRGITEWVTRGAQDVTPEDTGGTYGERGLTPVGPREGSTTDTGTMGAATPMVEEEVAATEVAAAPPVGGDAPETPAQIRARIPITPGDIRKRAQEVAAKYGSA